MKTLAITLSSLALVACGGGGGGGGSAVTPTTSTSTVTLATLSSTNQSVAAQEASSTAFLFLSSAQTVTGAQATDESALVAIARTHLDKLPEYLADAKANATLAGGVTSRSYACTYGGTLTASVSTASSNGNVAIGDLVTITSNGCKEWQGTISGSLTLAITSLTGTFGTAPYSAGMSMSFGGFTVATAQYSATMNGSLSLSVADNGTNSSTETLSAPSLTVSATYAGVTRTRTLSSYSASNTKSPDATYGYLRSYTASGTVTSSALSSQAVTFSTPTTIVRRGGDDYPYTGVFLVTGANQTKLKLTALSNSQVLEELDANGDGTFESSSTVAWNTLL